MILFIKPILIKLEYSINFLGSLTKHNKKRNKNLHEKKSISICLKTRVFTFSTTQREKQQIRVALIDKNYLKLFQQNSWLDS